MTKKCPWCGYKWHRGAVVILDGGLMTLCSGLGTVLEPSAARPETRGPLWGGVAGLPPCGPQHVAAARTQHLQAVPGGARSLGWVEQSGGR